MIRMRCIFCNMSITCHYPFSGSPANGILREWSPPNIDANAGRSLVRIKYARALILLPELANGTYLCYPV